MFYAILASLLISAFATSYAEYRLGYNLVDYLKDKLVGVLRLLRIVK